MKPHAPRFFRSVIATLVFCSTTLALADSYPVRPVRVLVPLAAGSAADFIARTLGSEMAGDLGQPLVIDNKPGAGGSIAMSELARAPRDGYTVALASQGNLVFNLSLYSRPGYDSARDFAPVGMVGGVSNVMVVPPGSPSKNVLDIIAAAKAKPGGLTFSSGGSGTSHHLSGVLFAQLTGTELMHVPYKGAPQGIMAVMSGEVDMGFYNTPTVLTQIRGGKLKALAITSTARSALLPDVPTVDASGVKGYEVNTWFALVAPVGTPAEVIARLNASLSKALAVPAVREKLAEQGIEIARDVSGAALARTLREDLAKWPAIIKASGATVD
ncbi:MAG: tripartite tricarboxylate transporter substrate binding protein [Polaromonas sp.]|nr:tripartite tricarboxylate transporter substrate binding protein [Polaromonas sp.]